MAEEQKHVDMQLAFRTEGQCFNAYIERQGEGAFIQLVGSINAGMCQADPLIYATWQRLMTLAVGRMAERLSGEPTQIVGRRTAYSSRYQHHSLTEPCTEEPNKGFCWKVGTVSLRERNRVLERSSLSQWLDLVAKNPLPLRPFDMSTWELAIHRPLREYSEAGERHFG